MPIQTPPTASGPRTAGTLRHRQRYATASLLCGTFLIAGLGIMATGGEPATPQASTSIARFEQTRLVFVDRHEVAFDRPGVLQLVLEEGENVTKGQIVARLEDSIAKAAVGVGEARVMNTAEIQSAKLQAELADLKYRVAKDKSDEFRKKPAETPAARLTTPTPNLELPTPVEENEDELYPQVYLDELRLSFEAARSDIGRFEKEHEVNQQGLLQAKAELEVLQLKAPRDGLVTRAFKQSGEGIQSGEKVLEIISTQRIRAEVDVPAVTAARLKVGMPITVIVEQPTGEKAMNLERYPTVLKFIDPTIGQVSHKVRIWAELDNSHGKLREGLSASIEIVPGAASPVTTPQ